MVSKFKKVLENQKSEILTKVMLGQDKEFDSSGDEVDLVQARILALAHNQLVMRDKEKIQKIDIALKKIQEGTYGTCVSCEDDIDVKRLEFNPFLPTCISCAENNERISKAYSK